MEKLSEGAEAVIFETEASGIRLLVKSRNRKKWRIAAIDATLRASRTRKEAKLLIAAKKAGVAVPGIAAYGRYSIFMQKLSGKLLKDTKPSSKDLRSIGRYLALMHSSGITHGDFTPANIMLTESGPFIIDFGLGTFSNNDEEKALDLLLLERSMERGNYAMAKRAYSSASVDSKRILSRLEEIKKRGRYQKRTLA